MNNTHLSDDLDDERSFFFPVFTLIQFFQISSNRFLLVGFGTWAGA